MQSWDSEDNPLFACRTSIPYIKQDGTGDVFWGLWLRGKEICIVEHVLDFIVLGWIWAEIPVRFGGMDLLWSLETALPVLQLKYSIPRPHTPFDFSKLWRNTVCRSVISLQFSSSWPGALVNLLHAVILSFIKLGMLSSKLAICYQSWKSNQ